MGARALSDAGAARSTAGLTWRASGSRLARPRAATVFPVNAYAVPPANLGRAGVGSQRKSLMALLNSRVSRQRVVLEGCTSRAVGSTHRSANTTALGLGPGSDVKLCLSRSRAAADRRLTRAQGPQRRGSRVTRWAGDKDDRAPSSSSSSSDAATASTSGSTEDEASTAVESSSAAAGDAEDDKGEKSNEEVLGVNVAKAEESSAAADAPGGSSRPPSINDDEGKKAGDGGKVEKPSGFFSWFRVVFQPLRLIALAINTFLFFFAAQLFNEDKLPGTHLVPVSYSRFLSAVKTDDISALSVDGVYLTWKPRAPFVVKRPHGSHGGLSNLGVEEKIEVAYTAARPEDATVPYEQLHKNKVEFSAVDKRHQNQRNVNTFLTVFVIGIAMTQFSRIGNQQRNGGMQGGGMGGMGGIGRGSPNTSAGRMSGGSQRGALPPPSTTFADVAGVDEAKEELAEIVDILKRPEHYTRLGARPPSGVLLVGAPGTGKTLLARAVAGEAGVPFISVSASEFVELYVGMGAARVRDVFARAREQAPAIVFIDEIDAVAKGRSDGKLRGMGNDEREQTLNQLLTELDGFDTGSLVICLAATNRADTLDTALKRPGRFDRTVAVERPDKQGRKEILGVHIGARNLPMHSGVSVDDVATMTAGFTGAELANLVNEAALLAGRKGLKQVGMEQFESAVLRTVAGIEKKRSLLGAAEKTVVSAHEVGHAVVGTAVGALIPGQQRPEVLSIVARSGGALGFTYIPPGEEERRLMFADELRGRLVTLMGGRAAEIVACNRVSTGALDDIQRATDLAYKAVAEYGLSPTVGPMSVSALTAGGGDDVFGGSNTATNANKQVEVEVKEALTSALWVAQEIVQRNLALLNDVSAELAEKEKVQGAELQTWLDKVVVPPDLERFLRGENPLPPEGSNVWDNLPLPVFANQPSKNAISPSSDVGPSNAR